MKAYRLIDQPQARIQQIAPDALLLIPLAALEPHGPHLPLGLRARLAEKLAMDAGDHLADSQSTAVFVDSVWPWLPAPRCHQNESPAPETEDAIEFLRVLLAGRAALGFRRIMLVALETTTDFLAPLRRVMQEAELHHGITIREPGSSFFHCGIAEVDDVLQELNLDPACEIHGDVKHTSMLMYIDEKAVGPVQDIPPCRIHVQARMLAGARTWADMGAEQRYIGTPSAATVKVGKKIYKAWRNRFADAGLAMIEGREPPDLPLLLRLSLKLK